MEQASFKHIKQIDKAFVAVTECKLTAHAMEAAAEAEDIASRDEVAEWLTNFLRYWHCGKLPSAEAGIRQIADDLVDALLMAGKDASYHRDFVMRYGAINPEVSSDEQTLAA